LHTDCNNRLVTVLITVAPTQNLDINSEKWREGGGKYLKPY